MTRPRRLRVPGLVAATCLAAIVVTILVVRGFDTGPATGVVRDERAAEAPFTGLTEGTVVVGGERLRVVVTDTLPERTAGLRDRRNASPYDGMLFVFAEDTETRFTMAGVAASLDIGFYDAAGREVDRLEMVPCSGTDATCPVYAASAPYRYAIETAPGELPTGRLAVGRTGRSGGAVGAPAGAVTPRS